MTIGFLMTDGYDAREFTEPYDDLRRCGIPTVIIGPTAGADIHDKLGTTSVRTELAAAQATAGDLDGIVIPGGHSPDRLRIVPAAVALVAQLDQSQSMIAAICHGPWMLIEARVVAGRRATSWLSVRTDLVNAGAHWVNAAVVHDANLITSRCPADVPAFSAAILRALSKGS